LYKGENEMRNTETKRVIRFMFNDFTFVKIEMFVLGDLLFAFNFTLDGGLEVKSKVTDMHADSIADQAKFLLDMDEFRKRFIQDKEAVLPELKTYLENEFDVNDGDTVVEYYEEV
jgi:hypothetical protein